MDFEWDPAKNRINLEKHGIRFETATRAFLDPRRIEVVDDRQDYGEVRRVVYARIDQRLYVVIFTRLEAEGVIRLISARKANLRERKRYDQG